MGFLLALAPIAAIMWYIYIKDKYDREPIGLLILSFILGIASVVPALLGGYLGTWLGVGISDSLYETFMHAFLVVALSEEFGKFFFLILFLYPQKDFDEPYDGIVYAVMIGMGFATFENIIYVTDGGVEVAVLRMFTAIPAHAAFGVIMGYYVGLAKFSQIRREPTPVLLFMALTWAVLAHGAYDFFLMQESYEWLTMFSFIVLFVSIYFAKTAIKIHNENSPFHPSRLGDNTLDEIKEKNNESAEIVENEVVTPKERKSLRERLQETINKKQAARRAKRARRARNLKQKQEQEEKQNKLPNITRQPILPQKEELKPLIKRKGTLSGAAPPTIKGKIPTLSQKKKHIPPPRKPKRKP